MNAIATVWRWGCLVGMVSWLNAGVLWDGLQEPHLAANPALSLAGGTKIGMQVTPVHTTRPASVVGYVGMPLQPAIFGRLPLLPTVTFSLWQQDDPLAAETASFTGFGLLSPSCRTESGLQVWRVTCDLQSLDWVLENGRSYVVGLTIAGGSEWLVRDGILSRSLLKRGAGWEELSPDVGWNLRLTVTPMPEPASFGAVLIALLVFAAHRRCALRRRSDLR